MAVFYVRSTDGNNADNGSTWALADATLAGSIAGTLAAGDTVYVSDAHAESTAGAVTLNWPGSAASPTKVICGDDAAEPPTAVATTGTVTTTGNSALTLASASDYVYFYGLTFSAGSGAVSAVLTATNTGLVYIESCKLRTAGTSGGTITFAAGVGYLVSTSVRFAAAGSGLSFSSGGKTSIVGGSLESGGTSPTALITTCSGHTVTLSGFDLTNASASINLASATGNGAIVQFRDCRLPASWSGSLHSGTPGEGSVFEMFNCDNGDTNYRYRKAVLFGTIQEETTLIRTGGASDGTTGYSMKMVSTANAEYPHQTLDSPEIVKWNDTTGSSVTATIEILFDSATNLTDAEIWMEVMYLGTSGVPLGAFVDDAKADVLATAADQTDSSETWTTTGMGNPNTRKLNVSFTPQEKGWVHAVVKVAKASQTVYYCPKMTVA